MSDAPPKSRGSELTHAERAVERARPEPARAAMDDNPAARFRLHPAARGDADRIERCRHPFFFRRGPMEMIATILIGMGFLMLFQPFALSLYTYSFITLLAGTVMFIIVSHFPE